MRSLNSALTLAENLGRELHVIWDVNRELNCRLEKLFQMPAGITSLIQPRTGRYGRQLRWLYLTSTCSIHLDVQKAKRWIDDGRSFEKELGHLSRISIATWSAFGGRNSSCARFVPTSELQAQIERYRSAGNLVGVHIRRTDNRESTAMSSTQRFIDLMQWEVDADSQVRFFVATDSPDEELRLRQRFPQRIITHTKQTLNRNDPRGIQDAVIDLYSLANCRKLIGSYWSSFSEVAAQLRGIELVIAKDPIATETLPQKIPAAGVSRGAA
jgi:hypothetical protein